MGFQECIAFTIPVPRILSMWPSQLSLCARMKFIMWIKQLVSLFKNKIDLHQIFIQRVSSYLTQETSELPL
jgi:hypothetical protein